MGWFKCVCRWKWKTAVRIVMGGRGTILQPLCFVYSPPNLMRERAIVMARKNPVLCQLRVGYFPCAENPNFMIFFLCIFCRHSQRACDGC